MRSAIKGTCFTSFTLCLYAMLTKPLYDVVVDELCDKRYLLY
jgi:hypothetical protein